jgi:DNA-binding IclR family transcriptional regulator
MIAGVSGLAAPVFDHAGKMVLAMVALGYSGAFDATWDGPNAIAVRAAAAAVSRRLGSPAPG